MKQVRLIPDPYAPLWCLWWLNPPPPDYPEDQEGIPSSPYLCGYLSKRDAIEAAQREGWEVVEVAQESNDDDGFALTTS